MKITSFNPQIFTTDMEPVIKLFEGLGFERRHKTEGIGALDVTGVRMVSGDGFALDISQNGVLTHGDMVGIRMNVDNFEEAYQLLTDRGFRNIYGSNHIEMPDRKSAILVSPTGFGINLVEHIKKR